MTTPKHEDTPDKAATLRVRSSLLAKIKALIEANGWTQTKRPACAA